MRFIWQNTIMHFLLEAIVVGIITLIVGIIVSKLMEIGRKKEYDEKDYTLQMAGGLFITGFVVHILCEAFGFNRWYCKHGDACKSS
jgi:hypothetical protein